MSGRARLYTITTARPRNGKQETKGVRGQSGAPVHRRHASRQPQPAIATLSQIVRIVVFLKALPTPPTSVCGWYCIAVALLEARVWAKNSVCTSTLLSQRPVVAALSQLARFAASLEHLPPLLDGACSLHVPLSRSARRAVPSIAVAPLVAAVLVKVHGGTEFQQQPARNGCRWTAG